jgi:hypothetical protein
MDGLSAATGIAGVISLAIQLGQTAITLVKFFDTISDAPNEVIRLRDLLRLIYATSSGVRNALECQRRLHGGTVAGAEDICDALTVCQRKLALIQDLLDKTENVQCGRTLVSRSWAKFRLAGKKDTISEFERQLGQGLDVLNVLLTANLMYGIDFPIMAIVRAYSFPQGAPPHATPSSLSVNWGLADPTMNSCQKIA